MRTLSLALLVAMTGCAPSTYARILAVGAPTPAQRGGLIVLHEPWPSDGTKLETLGAAAIMPMLKGTTITCEPAAACTVHGEVDVAIQAPATGPRVVQVKIAKPGYAPAKLVIDPAETPFRETVVVLKPLEGGAP